MMWLLTFIGKKVILKLNAHHCKEQKSRGVISGDRGGKEVEGSAEGGRLLASAIFRSDTPPPPRFFLRGFVKDEVYVPPVPVTLNNLKDRTRKATAKSNQPLKQNVWHEVEYRLDVCRARNGAQTWSTLRKVWKNILSCSLQYRAFNFCVAVTFLPTNLRHHSHHL
jgi:hypothetical protein